jgi:hypothetical protein
MLRKIQKQKIRASGGTFALVASRICFEFARTD